MKNRHPHPQPLPKEVTGPNLGARFLLMILFGLLFYALLFLMTSCATVAGVGEDMQSLGQEVEEAAQ